jgi:putrescine transport system permease protein
VTPEINAISTLMIGVVTLGVLTAAYFTKKSSEREDKERRRAFGAAG